MLLFSNEASAVYFYTGNDLLKNCSEVIKYEAGSKEINRIELGDCFGYIIGAFEMYGFHTAATEQAETICVPESAKINRNQLVIIVIKYLKDTPEKLHEPAAYLVWRALVNAFPCNKE